jgi:uncharacterized membrane protein YgcG
MAEELEFVKMVVICSKSALHVLFGSIKPLLEKARGRGAVLVAPLPWYITLGCGCYEDHMPDKQSTDSKARLTGELCKVAGNLRNMLFKSGMRNVKLLDPSSALNNMAEATVWLDAPIHPADEVYGRLAELAFKLCVQAGNTSSRKRPRKDRDRLAGGSSSSGGDTNTRRGGYRHVGGSGSSVGGGGGRGHPGGHHHEA